MLAYWEEDDEPYPTIPNPVLRVLQGERIVAQLPKDFVLANKDRFVAISFATGRVLIIANSLLELNREMLQSHIQENCYVKRLGHPSITLID